MTDLEGPPEHDLVEWDYTYARALAFRPAGEEHVAPTGAERAADSATRWLPVVPEYPEDFLPRFPELLGRSVFLLSDDGLHVRQLFPGADFDPGNVRRLLEFSVQQTRRDRLEQTMYFAVEAMETGEPVPPDVAGYRAAVRHRARELTEQIRRAPVSELPDFEIEFPPVQNFFSWDPETLALPAVPDSSGRPVEPFERLPTDPPDGPVEPFRGDVG
jgi:hypothetical protein